jgi:large subunit ribosomal protein L15
MIKTHKRKKSSRHHGKNMGTSGTGARKKSQGSGHKGGKGMSGSGKRADHKKTLITKLYGNTYFGKKGVTSRGTKRDKANRINVGDIQVKYKAGNLDLNSYKILGSGEVKDKFVIKASSASKTAVEKIEKAGGKIELVHGKKEEAASKKVSKEKEVKKE